MSVTEQHPNPQADSVPYPAARHPVSPWLAWGWLGVFALAVLTALLIRPLMPVDETRYLAVAWDMWRSGSWIVPHLNGEAYSHKPPLLFWLIHLGWWLFGVNEITPRLIGPAFSLASLFLLRSIALQLWPERQLVARLAPWLMVGVVYWLGFATMVMFDQLVVFAVLLGVFGLLRVSHGHALGWLWLFLGVAAGVLAKGPFVLIFLVPLTISVPWWTRVPAHWSWFLKSGSVGLAGSLVGLAWALIAAHIGGPDYAEQILWGQMADRAVDAFDHAEPVYYYLIALPLMFLPWTLLPVFWHRGRRDAASAGSAQRATTNDPAVRRWWVLLAAWIAIPLILLSLASGKLPHYVMPALPPLVLLAAWLLAGRVARDGAARLDTRPIAAFWVLFGLVLAVLPWLGKSRILQDLPWWTSVLAVALILMALSLWPRRALFPQVARVAGMTAVVFVLIHLAFFAIRPSFDYSSYAPRVAQLQEKGRPLIFLGKYRGEYDFYGRLQQPLRVVYGVGTANDFCQANSDGVVLARSKDPVLTRWALFTTRFRSGFDAAIPCAHWTQTVASVGPRRLR